MPSYSELIEERVWREETIPSALSGLRTALNTHFGLGPSAIGIRGDNRHLSGYHRSRNWLLQSRYATNRRYSVTETPGNVGLGNGSWICAIDISINSARLLKMCFGLDVAVRSGRLEKVTEWYGNLNGDTRVDGYNNILNRVATSDSSHLWHLHISFDRGRANDDHTDVFKALTGQWDAGSGTPGTPGQPQDMEWTERMLRNAPLVKLGHKGDWARTAQGLLIARGFSVKMDGDFGPDSTKKTKDMQRKFGAEEVDGVFGPETWTIGFTGNDGL